MADDQLQEVTPSIKQQNLVQRIAALGRGESYTESKRLPFEGTTVDMLTSERRRLINWLNKSASRANKQTGAKYTTEGGGFKTHNGDNMVCVVVTCVELGDDQEL